MSYLIILEERENAHCLLFCVRRVLAILSMFSVLISHFAKQLNLYKVEFTDTSSAGKTSREITKILNLSLLTRNKIIQTCLALL